jgi:hypothetical protein
VTENGRLAEVTEAAERMGDHSAALARKQDLYHRGRRVPQRRSTEAYWAILSLWFSLCASVLSVLRILPFRC